MDQQSCISNPFWLDYSLRKLSQSQLNTIQKHVDSCEICSDIKKGIDAMTNPKELGAIVEGINIKVSTFNKNKHNLTMLWYWSAAAFLVFGLGLSLYFMNRPASLALQMAEEATNELHVNEIPIDTPRLNYKVPEKQMVNSATIRSIPETNKDFALEDMAEEKNKASFMEDDSEDRSTQKNLETAPTFTFSKTDSNSKPVTMVMDTKSNLDDSYALPPSAESKDKEIKTIESVQIASQESSAFKKLNIKRTARKTESLPAPLNNSMGLNNSSLLKNEALNDSLEFAKATALYALGNYEQSLGLLQTLSTHTASIYYEDVLMLKAKILIHQGLRKQAIDVLETVISNKGKRHAEAKALLDTIH